MTDTNLLLAEKLQAQVAVFASQGLDPSVCNGLFGAVGNLAAGFSKDGINRVGCVGDILGRVAGLDAVVRFADFRQLPAYSTAVEGRQERLAAYPDFAPLVGRLVGELSAMDDPAGHPGFIGSGKTSSVFRVFHNDSPYAVRLPRHDAPRAVDGYMAGVVRAGRHMHVEDIVAASYEEGVTIARYLPYSEVGSLSSEDIAKISDEQLTDLVQILRVLGDAGVDPDISPKNFLYDTSTGFYIVDLHEAGNPENYPEHYTADIIGWMAAVLMRAGICSNGTEELTDSEQIRGLYRQNLGIMRRYRDIVAGVLEGEAQNYALAVIDVQISLANRRIKEKM